MNGEAIAAQAVAGAGPGPPADPPDAGAVPPDRVMRAGFEGMATEVAPAGHTVRATRP